MCVFPWLIAALCRSCIQEEWERTREVATVHQIVIDVDKTFSRSRPSLRAGKVLPLFLCLLFISLGDAQERNRAGTINGQVVDQSNGVLQDAAVILLNGSASVRLQQAKTGQDGTFAFQNVPPGDYLVEVQRTGFTQAERKVTLTAAQTLAPLTIQMTVAGPGQQVTVTAEVNSFQTDESSTATKMNIPLNEIPQGVGVANQALIQSQQDTYFADAANNISGVNRDVLLAGDVGNALTIRGLPLGIFSNYYRDGFAFDGMVPSDTTDVDRVEILKGPASVLYGRATSSGIVNLITKEPLPTTHVTFTLQGDRFGAVRPTFDITGPIGSSDKLFYRLNAELADTSTFRNYFHDRRYFLSAGTYLEARKGHNHPLSDRVHARLDDHRLWHPRARGSSRAGSDQLLLRRAVAIFDSSERNRERRRLA